MTNTTATAQELLDQILETGRDWTEIGRAKSGNLTKKAKELAAQGEDILVDKLGVEDTEVGREALRKGIGAGAAAGALALVLSSRSGRKMATLGGLAGWGVLAYKAYEKNGGEMPNWKEEVVGLIKGPKAEVRAETLLRAMVAAARSDDVISTDEMALIQAHDGASVEVLESVMSQEPDAGEIAALADNEQTAREIYAVSCRVANGVETAERAYLDELAMKLGIDPELAARIETDIRTG